MLSITNYEGTLTEALVCRGKPIVRKNIDGVFELTLDASERDNPHSFQLIAESIIDAGGISIQDKATTTEIPRKCKVSSCTAYLF